MQGIVDELRQGAAVYASLPAKLEFLTYVHASACTAGAVASAAAIQCRVTYECSGGSCTRLIRNPDGSGTGAAVRVVKGLSSNEIFCYMPSSTPPACAASSGVPTYVGVKLVLPASSGGSSTTLENGAALRDAAANLVN